MIHLSIPGFGDYRLEHAVFDYNGTLAIDGVLIPGVREKLAALSRQLEIHVVTADTFGSAKQELRGLPGRLTVLSRENQHLEKLDYIKALGPGKCVTFGNGRNDREMLRAAAIGIAVLQPEGAASESLQAATIICPTILDAIELLGNPHRLTATLRS